MELGISNINFGEQSIRKQKHGRSLFRVGIVKCFLTAGGMKRSGLRSADISTEIKFATGYALPITDKTALFYDRLLVAGDFNR